MRLCMGSVLPWPAGRLGQLLTAVQSSCGSAISAVSLTTSLGSAQPLQQKPNQWSVQACKPGN